MRAATTAEARPPGRGLLVWPLVVVVLLLPVGLTLGALTGWLFLSPILGMVLPLLAATGFLRREGRRWRDLGFLRPMPVRAFFLYTLATVFSVYVLTIALRFLLDAAGSPPINTTGLKQLIEGDLVNYLLFLIPVSWGSAAFGEELLVRGFIFDRLLQLLKSPAWAIFAQAGLFAVAHVYQGVTGMAVVFLVGLVMGTVYLRCGRNLWPLIVAHGLIDTVGITSIYLGLGWV